MPSSTSGRGNSGSMSGVEIAGLTGMNSNSSRRAMPIMGLPGGGTPQMSNVPMNGFGLSGTNSVVSNSATNPLASAVSGQNSKRKISVGSRGALMSNNN